jgi:hypothetical protein
MPKLADDERFHMLMLGKPFLVTGLFQTDNEANAHLEQNADEGVACVAGGIIFVAKNERAPFEVKRTKN